MADSKSKKENEASGEGAAAASNTAAASSAKRMGIRLAPVDNSDQPVFANYTNVNVAPGMVFIDFGFLEPAMLAALPRVARSGGKLPESVNGRLAVRVAMGYDGLANMYQQLGQVLKGLSQAQARAANKGGN